MLIKYWPVLVVDDEPDVLAISRIAMKGIKCFGVPTKVFTCGSKAEAVEFMKGYSLQQGSFVSVAFIDVVMETDEAGLELCNYIRNELNNWETQLLIRTGQAALYSEKDVIDQYEICGYINKVEETEEKLYSLVKTSLRQYLYRLISHQALQSAFALMQCGQDKESFIQLIRYILNNINRDVNGREIDHMTADLCYYFGDQSIGAGVYLDSQKALDDRNRIITQPVKYTGRVSVCDNVKNSTSKTT